MKSSILIGILAVLFILSTSENRTSTVQPINSLIGDVSFLSKFGYLPDASTDENLRIKTHLEYIEKILRGRDCSHLSPAMQAKRNHSLDLLHNYWTAGKFPKNYDFVNERKPCFIDKNNTICAVGHLVEQTAGWEVAFAINENHKYDEILSMNDHVVDEWISTSGLTKEECAMIQPSYTEYKNHVSFQFRMGSALLGGTSLALAAVNVAETTTGRYNPRLAALGLLAGAATIFNGYLNYERAEVVGNGVVYTYVNKSNQDLSNANVYVGAATMTSAILNIIVNRSGKPKSSQLNVYSFPASDKQPGLGFSLTKAL